MKKRSKQNPSFLNYKLRPVFRDRRGDIFDFVEGEVGHVGMVTFKKGVTRGNHYHKRSTQFSYVLDGRIRLVVSDFSKRKRREFVLSPGTFTRIPPRTIHTYTALTPARMIDITTLKRGKRGYEDDTYRLLKNFK